MNGCRFGTRGLIPKDARTQLLVIDKVLFFMAAGLVPAASFQRLKEESFTNVGKNRALYSNLETKFQHCLFGV